MNGSHTKRVLSMNALAIAFTAALTEQVFHETMHGVVALLVGVRWEWMNLFAVATGWTKEMGIWKGVAIAGSPALLNILTAFVCIAAFHGDRVKSNPSFRLFVFYLGVYSLFAGFGYLLVDPLFYRPGENLGDWKQIVGLLGGGWIVRLPLILIGAGGTLWGYVWTSRSVFSFGANVKNKEDRTALAFPLLLIPYLGVNLIFTILSIWHPLGPAGIIIALFKYWFGFIGIFWSFFIASNWLRSLPVIEHPSPLPLEFSRSWFASAVIGLLIAVFVLLPTVYFG